MNKNITENITRIKGIMGLVVEHKNNDLLLEAYNPLGLLQDITTYLSKATGDWWNDTGFWNSIKSASKNPTPNEKLLNDLASSGSPDRVRFLTANANNKVFKNIVSKYFNYELEKQGGSSRYFEDLISSIDSDDLKEVIKNSKNINEFIVAATARLNDEYKVILTPILKKYYKQYKNAILSQDQINRLVKTVSKNYKVSDISGLFASFKKSADEISSEIQALSDEFTDVKADGGNIEELTNAYTLEVNKKLNQLAIKGKETYEQFSKSLKLDKDIKTLLKSNSEGLMNDLKSMRDSNNDMKSKVGKIITSFKHDMKTIISFPKTTFFGIPIRKIKLSPDFWWYFAASQKSPVYVLYRTAVNNTVFEPRPYKFMGKTLTPKVWIGPNSLRALFVIALSSGMMAATILVFKAFVAAAYHWSPLNRIVNYFGGEGTMEPDEDQILTGEGGIADFGEQLGWEFQKGWNESKFTIAIPIINGFKATMLGFVANLIHGSKSDDTSFDIFQFFRSFFNGLNKDKEAAELDKGQQDLIKFYTFLQKTKWNSDMSQDLLEVTTPDGMFNLTYKNDPDRIVARYKPNGSTFMEIDENGNPIVVVRNPRTDDVRNTETVDQNDGEPVKNADGSTSI